MSKMAELETVINDLRAAAAAINEAADTLTEMFSGQAPAVAAQPAAPLPSLEDVRGVLATKSRLGYRSQVRDLLLKHGAERLSEIDPSRYTALLNDAKELPDE